MRERKLMELEFRVNQISKDQEAFKNKSKDLILL